MRSTRNCTVSSSITAAAGSCWISHMSGIFPVPCWASLPGCPGMSKAPEPWLPRQLGPTQGGSLFQDAQSGEELTHLRSVATKYLRDVGYAHGPQQADRRISEG